MSTNGKSEETTPEAPRKTCFVVCPIGSDLSPQRKHSDQTLRHIIAPVLKAAGFDDPFRADRLSESGNITRQIINHIREDSLIIADLTGHNPNVFYELAIRHCTGRPFIQMIRKGESIPFDLGPMRTIFFDLTDPDDVVATREELARQVTAALADGNQVDTPVGAAMDFERLRSGSGVEQMLSTLIERVEGISRSNATQPGRYAVLERHHRVLLDNDPIADAIHNAVSRWQVVNQVGTELPVGLFVEIHARVEHLLAQGFLIDRDFLDHVVSAGIENGRLSLPSRKLNRDDRGEGALVVK